MNSERRVQRPWGSYETLASDGQWLLKRLTVQPGKRLSLQYHRHRAEYWIVVSGEGVALIGDQRRVLRPGVMLEVPMGAPHRIENTGAQHPLELVEVQLGPQLVEEDIVRLQDDYGRVG